MQFLNTSLFVIFLFNLLFLLLTAETIIDSVYSDPILDGYIKFSQNDQFFSVNNWMYNMHIGDSGDAIVWPDPNSFFKSYLSFDLPTMPSGFHVDSVYVRLYQYFSIGDGYTDDFPVWNVTGGDTIKCIMSHIDYGKELDVGDWEKGDAGNPNTYQNNIGTITESGEDGYRYLDVTACVIQDYELNRDKTQYRIAFQIDTDWDNESDMVAFMTSSAHSYTEIMPTIYLIFSNEFSYYEDYIIKPDLQLQNYPNPFKSSGAERCTETTIFYNLFNPENVQLQVFNIKGQLVTTLVNEYQSAGKYTIRWDASKQSSGIYFYQIKTINKIQTGKCLLLK